MNNITPTTQLSSSHPQQIKWNNIYRKKIKNDSKYKPQPCSLLDKHSYLLPNQGQALDLACGQGGNAIMMANQGLTVSAWDISDIAIDHLNSLNIANLQASTINIERSNLPKSAFDVIVVSCYLHRPLCASLVEALNPGGLLFYQTFHQNKVAINGPSNKNFLLKNNELLTLFGDLTPLFYQQLGHQGDLSVGDRNLASLIAEKPPLNNSV